ncbi:hemerythrin domain-containing protein [Ideonella sp.]|uniref:hemerythrin domain-containing protein n=1 Tax=Ideonella sp. TaxID=1929293 RepID=UPI0035B0BD9D
MIDRLARAASATPPTPSGAPPTPAGALSDGRASASAQAAQDHLVRIATPVHRRAAAAAAPVSIYDALRASHEIQRALCRQIVRIPGSRPDKRVAVFKSLRLELAAHEAAEERFLYVPMLMHDTGLDPSRHALHEHHQMDEMVEDIQALAPEGEAWMTHVKALAHKVRHHLDEEEHKFFQASGKILSDTQKLTLGRRYLRDHARMLRVLAGKG